MNQPADLTTNFMKVESIQRAELQSVMRKRQPTHFTATLSPEAQQAIQQETEERRMKEAATKGKRGSKGNVIFSDTVQVMQKVPVSNKKRASCSDIFEDETLRSNLANHLGELLGSDKGDDDGLAALRKIQGRRPSYVASWVQQRGMPTEASSGLATPFHFAEDAVQADSVDREIYS